VSAAEERRARDEDVGPGLACAGRGGGIDATVDLEPEIESVLGAPLPELTELRQGDVVERLPPEPGVHRHHQHEVELAEHAAEALADRGTGVDHDPRAAPAA